MIMTKTLCRASTAELSQMPMASALVLSPLVDPRSWCNTRFLLIRYLHYSAWDNIIVIVIVCCCFERATSCKLGAAACLQFSHSFPPISSFAAIFLPGSSALTLECAWLKYARRVFATLAWFTNVEEPLLKPPICVHQHPQPEFYNPRGHYCHTISLTWLLPTWKSKSKPWLLQIRVFVTEKRNLFKVTLSTVQVYNCENTTEVYEDRSYECFGNFSDSGLVYTVVRRLDLPHRWD